MSRRRYPLGAEPSSNGVNFRVWAPDSARVDVVLLGKEELTLDRGDDGYHTGESRTARAGDLYRFRLDGGDTLYPDPASRFQPEGPHGPSEVIDPSYAWTDRAFSGIAPGDRVVYEMHIGTLTKEGTFAAAERELPRLRALGITLLEVMPLAEFAGSFGWGYDGVNLFAPFHGYGRPDDLRHFVDAAHKHGLGVVLDVVYNHFGPDGNYLACFSKDYFTKKYANDWGEAINFDGPRSAPVRELVVSNAAYWIDEFHLDGLRLDATQSINDDSERHVITELCEKARAAAGKKPIFICAENEPQEAKLARPTSRGGYGVDSLWNDDFHHSAVVALTGRREAYYSDTAGTPQELLSAVKWGYLFQGQRYAWQKGRRGQSALDLEAGAFVTYLENHDQVANSGLGARLCQLTTAGRLRALTAFFLLAPPVPMLFQGQEYGSTQPFLYFADHTPDLAKAVHNGRREFLTQFPSLTDEEAQARLAMPHARETFERCKLDSREAEDAAHLPWTRLHTDLLALRRTEKAFAAQNKDRIAGAVLGTEAFLLRFMCDDGDRLLLVNLGPEIALGTVSEPLFAPPTREPWRISWSSESPRYGGGGVAPVETNDGVRIPAHAAVVLR